MTQLLQKMRRGLAMVMALLLLLGSVNLIAIANTQPALAETEPQPDPMEEPGDKPDGPGTQYQAGFSATLLDDGTTYDTLKLVYHVGFPGYGDIPANNSALSGTYEYAATADTIMLEKSTNTDYASIFGSLKKNSKLGFCGWSLTPHAEPLDFYDAESYSNESPQPRDADIWRGNHEVKPDYFPDEWATIANKVKTVNLYGVWYYPKDYEEAVNYTIRFYYNFPGDDNAESDDSPDLDSFVEQVYTGKYKRDTVSLIGANSVINGYNNTSYLNFFGWSASAADSAFPAGTKAGSGNGSWGGGAKVKLGDMGFQNGVLELYGMWRNDSGAMVGTGRIRMAAGWHDGCYEPGTHPYPGKADSYPTAPWLLQPDGTYQCTPTDDAFLGRDNYTFVGWGMHRQTSDGELLGTESPKNSKNFVFTDKKGDAQINVYAIFRKSILFRSTNDGWERRVSGLCYQCDADDIDKSPDSGYVMQFPDISSLEGDSRKFLGWRVAEVSGKSLLGDRVIRQGENVLLKGEEVFEAVWETWQPQMKTLTYLGNTKDTVSNLPPFQQFPAGGRDVILSDAIPQRSGYTFRGWSTVKDGVTVEAAPGASLFLSADTTLYAIWEQNGYINVALTTATFGYTGQEQSLADPQVTSDHRSVTWETLQNLVTVVNGSATDVGTYKATLRGPAQYQEESGKVYNITYTGANLIIQPKAISILPQNAGKVYGDPDPDLIALIGTGIQEEAVLNALRNDVKVIRLGNEETVGVHENALGFESGLAETLGKKYPNYTFTQGTGSFTIASRKAVVTLASGSAVYNGSDQTLALMGLGREGEVVPTQPTAAANLVQGHRVTAVSTRDNVRRDVLRNSAGVVNGYEILAAPADVIISDESGADVSRNYALEIIPGRFVIEPISATVTLPSGSAVYTGQRLELSMEGVTASGLVGDHRPVVTLNTWNDNGTARDENIRSDVRRDANGLPVAYDVTANARNVQILSRRTDVTANYQISVENGTFLVEPAPLTLANSSETFTYNGQARELAPITVSGLTRADRGRLGELFTLRYTLGADEAAVVIADAKTGLPTQTNAGDYAYGVTLEYQQGTRIQNYALPATPATAMLTVLPAPLTVTPRNTEYTYDGQNHSFQLEELNTRGLVRGQRITAFTTDDTAYRFGAQTLALNSVTVEDELGVETTQNYEISYGSAQVNIRRRPVSLIVTQESKIFDGTPLNAQYAQEGLAEGDRLADVVLNDNGRTEVGSNPVTLADYRILRRGADGNDMDMTDSYTARVVNGNVEVMAREATYTVRYFYDGTLDEAATETYDAFYGQSVEGYQAKLRPDTRLQGTAGLPLVVGMAPEENVIDVYYTSVNPSVIITNLAAPMAGNTMNATVGDTKE